MTEKTNIIELKSFLGKSKLRDVELVQGSSTVTNALGDSEYRLQTSSSNDSAILQSAERGRYVGGLGCEIGIGIRIATLPTRNMEYRWGLYDTNNGFYFKYNGTGLYVVSKRDGVETAVHQSQFNGELGSSTLDLSIGRHYKIMFSYGYGSITFYVQNKSNTLDTPFISLHTFDILNKTSIKNPNLPLSAEINNNGLAASGDMYVADRHYCVLGKYTPRYRLNSAYRVNAPVNSTQNFLPILTIRRRQGYNGTIAKLNSVDFVATSTQIVQFRSGTTLTGANFVPLPDQQVPETILEYDQSATNFGGGVVIWTGIVVADRSGLQKLEDFSSALTEYDNMTLCVKATSVTNGNLTVCVRISEEW